MSNHLLYRGLGVFLIAPLVFGCAGVEPVAPAEPPPQVTESDAEERERDRERITSLEHEIERLRSEREVAEATRRATDSEVLAGRNRTAAVSMLAEALISVRPYSRLKGRRMVVKSYPIFSAVQKTRSRVASLAEYLGSRFRIFVTVVRERPNASAMDC